MSKVLNIIILFGLFLIIWDIVRSRPSCPPQKVIYRYIPRTINEELEKPALVTDIFESMFSMPSPWMRGVNTYDKRKQEVLNKYFISQV